MLWLRRWTFGARRGNYCPIARDEDSIITRRVAKGGKVCPYFIQDCSFLWKYSLGLYSPAHWSNPSNPSPFSYIGFPLLGDDLYGGSLEDGIQRQALHCHYLSFYHPFLEQDLQLESPLPDDFSNLITQLSTNTL